MLPKSYRLSRPVLLLLRKNGHKKNEGVATFISKSNAIGHLRAGVEISLRIDKRATVRNHLRRQIYDLLRDCQVLQKPVDLLVITNPSTQTNLPTLKKLLESL